MKISLSQAQLRVMRGKRWRERRLLKLSDFSIGNVLGGFSQGDRVNNPGESDAVCVWVELRVVWNPTRRGPRK